MAFAPFNYNFGEYPSAEEVMVLVEMLLGSMERQLIESEPNPDGNVKVVHWHEILPVTLFFLCSVPPYLLDMWIFT